MDGGHAESSGGFGYVFVLVQFPASVSGDESVNET